MRVYLFPAAFVALVAFILISATQQPLEAGVVVPDSGSSGDQQAAALPGLPNYSSPDDEETRKRLRRQQQPISQTPGPSGAAAYSQPQMPLPPTYAPGSPASYSQPASLGQLPMAPTAHGLYDSPMGPGGRMGVGQPGAGQMPGPGQQMLPNQPGSLASQPGTLQIPPSPTAPAPMATSPGTVVDQRLYGPQSPTGVSQSAAPRAPATAHLQQTTMPSGDSKPFQDYRRTSPYSPYMNLFRYSDMNRGIDNYYNYVKPALEQNQQNRRIDRNITQLQNSSRYQNLSLQQINQQNQARQRPGNIIPGADVQPRAPATFMNVQQYYPGFNK